MEISEILSLLAVGLIAGFLADMVVKNKYGLLGDLIIGITGSVIGYLVLDQFGISIAHTFIGRVISAFIGAVILLVVLNIFIRDNKKKSK